MGGAVRRGKPVESCHLDHRAALSDAPRNKKLPGSVSEPPPSPVRLHPNLAEAYRIKVAALHEALEDEETRDEAFEIIRSLIEKVIIHDLPEGGSEIELVGEITAMVHIALSDNKKAAPVGAAFDAGMLRSVVVDAGAGFEPATFRL